MITETEKLVRSLRGLRMLAGLFLVLVLVFAFTQGGIGSMFAALVAAICGTVMWYVSLAIGVAKGNIIIKSTDEEVKK